MDFLLKLGGLSEILTNIMFLADDFRIFFQFFPIGHRTKAAGDLIYFATFWKWTTFWIPQMFGPNLGLQM